MKDQLVSFETAKLAKERGWKKNKYGNAMWDNGFYVCEVDDFYFSDRNAGDLLMYRGGGSLSSGHLIADAPTQSLLQHWLRETFKIHIIINCLDEYCWAYHIPNIGGEKDFKTYEEALEYALQEGLKLIKS